MNKTALGFFVGIAIVVAGLVGYLLASKGQPAQVATPAISVPAAPKADATPVTPVADAAKAVTPATPPAATATPAPEAAVNMAKAAATDSTVKMTRTLNAATYAPGGTLDVALSLEVGGSDAVRALGVQETIPDGFTFDGIVGDVKPDLVPEVGKTGQVEFVWIQVPKLPVTFAYRVKAADGTTGVREFTGQTLMRGSGPEVRSEVVVTPVSSGEPGAAPAPAPAPVAEATPAPAEAVPAPAEAAPAAPAEAAPKMLDAEKLKAMTERIKAQNPEVKDAPPVEVARSVAAGGYTPGQPLEVSVTLSYTGTDPVTALALVETLPDGWTFDKVTGGAAPAVSPPAGKGGNVTFIWVQVPAFPATLTYTVNVPAADTGARTLAGKAAYRLTGGQIEGPPAATELTNK